MDILLVTLLKLFLINQVIHYKEKYKLTKNTDQVRDTDKAKNNGFLFAMYLIEIPGHTCIYKNI